MPLDLDKYVDLSGLENRSYSDSLHHLCDLGEFGGYNGGDLRSGDFDVLKDLQVEELLNYTDQNYSLRASEWSTQHVDFDRDFTDRFRGELEGGDFGVRAFDEYLLLVSRLVGGVSERLSSSLVRKLMGMEVKELVGLYYRCLLNLRKYLPRSTKKDLDNYGSVARTEGRIVLNRYRSQVFLSVIPGLCRWLVAQKRSPNDDKFYPFEVAHPNPHSEDVYKHCLKLLRFVIGDNDQDKMPLQESVILREVLGLTEKYLMHTPAGIEIMDLVSKVKAYRMGASMYQSQINARVYRGDTTQPLVNYHSSNGVNVSYGSGVPPFVEAEASFKHQQAVFYAIDKIFKKREGRGIDLSEYGLGDQLFGTSGNVSYVGADLDLGDGALPDGISEPGSIDTAVFASLLHKLRGDIRLLVDDVLASKLKEGGKCVVVSPAWSSVPLGDRSVDGRTKADNAVWLSQLFQDSTSNPHAIIPVEKFLLVPRYMENVYGIKVKIDSMGMLFDSEENDTLNRFQIVYELERKKKGIRGLISRAFRGISG
ncbi:hypothetical protein HOG17_01320 [Candidatus Peregrinibacteria bacterium]|jgi:hypothetical protein|nr:hypothetical protein [Candidatus Peregrinibacteria bacterium]MBT4148372.1 hypothetical protein [Candidatus Peregrinibacteria bacterium]MBT4365999.1 hypothetical protein [Candidatus Peregrinibacteria bacterium]MBT4456624.1 hypothetical protein [Candidatus Peregrinibacteria bacterium]